MTTLQVVQFYNINHNKDADEDKRGRTIVGKETIVINPEQRMRALKP